MKKVMLITAGGLALLWLFQFLQQPEKLDERSERLQRQMKIVFTECGGVDGVTMDRQRCRSSCKDANCNLACDLKAEEFKLCLMTKGEPFVLEYMQVKPPNQATR